jgi:hypothetical protein
LKNGLLTGTGTGTGTVREERRERASAQVSRQTTSLELALPPDGWALLQALRRDIVAHKPDHALASQGRWRGVQHGWARQLLAEQAADEKLTLGRLDAARQFAFPHEFWSGRIHTLVDLVRNLDRL